MTETATLTLADFLLARIAEDEEAARAAIASNEPGEPWGYDHIPGDGLHIARWHPGRVLAECEAKRWLISTRTSVIRMTWVECMGARIDNPEPLELRVLAFPYADHPDYRQEWAVTS
jgi:hypothetical protein